MDAIIAKVSNAEKHIAELDDAIGRLMASEQRPYSIEGKHDPSCKHFNFIGYSKEVPHALSLLAGDAVHNLRSSLDHMISSLAEKNGGSSDPGSRVQFVARSKGKDFRKDRKLLACIGSPALELLETLQPFHAPSPSEAPLYVLGELDNRDKHRQLISVSATAALPAPAELRMVEMKGVDRR